MEISMKHFLISCFSPRTIGVTASSSPALAFSFSLAPSLISLFPLDFFFSLASCFLCILILQPDNPKQPLPLLIFFNHSFAWTLFIAHKWTFRFQRQLEAEPSRALGVTRDQAVGCCRASDGGGSHKNCPLLAGHCWNRRDLRLLPCGCRYFTAFPAPQWDISDIILIMSDSETNQRCSNSSC